MEWVRVRGDVHSYGDVFQGSSESEQAEEGWLSMGSRSLSQDRGQAAVEEADRLCAGGSIK